MNDKSWKKIFDDYKINLHNFDEKPFFITAKEIKTSCKDFENTNEKEVRILCKQDSRDDRPEIFKNNGLFILPVKNGKYVIIKGEGYVDIPNIEEKQKIYTSKIDFELDSINVGDSEMQHLDYAYASSLIRTFMNDTSLILTIRGRKYTPKFDFIVNKHKITTESVQTEIDAGYEGKDKIVLIEAKNNNSSNVIIRQLYYPFKQWKNYTKKDVFTLFFQKIGNEYHIWQFGFNNENDYNSIYLIKSSRYEIINNCF